MNAKMVHPISQLHIEGNPNRLGLAVVAYLLPVLSVSINLPKFPKATTRSTEMRKITVPTPTEVDALSR